jgi:alcohol dehydrogenase
LVTDPGLEHVGHPRRAVAVMEAAGLAVFTFDGVKENPTEREVGEGVVFARTHHVDCIVAVGGGSSMDCAKGINFVLTNGGTMADYRGYGKAPRPMLPMIGVPTTAGTGSEAQSYALISDPVTHVKMACGDPKAAFGVVILDPATTTTQPRHVTAAAGYDAISHAVETWVTTKRTAMSDLYSREAWRLLSQSFERVLGAPQDVDARGRMLLGAFFAGAAIEQSMLGATHACANPLTATYGTAHGVAIGLLLRHVVTWNADADDGVRQRYGLLAGDSAGPARAESLVARLGRMAEAAEFPEGLAAAGVREEDRDRLAAAAAEQWTGTFNPRPFNAAGAAEIYEMAW